MWFAESAWPTLVVLAVLAALLFSAWSTSKRGYLLVAATVCVLLMPLFWWLETVLITPREKVEQSIFEITSAFQQKRLDDTLTWISPQAPHLKLLVLGAIKIVDVSDDMRVSDLQIKLSNEDSRAVSTFRVNARVGLVGTADRQHHPTRWEADWRLEGGEWRMIQLTELDPMTGEQLNRLTQLLGGR